MKNNIKVTLTFCCAALLWNCGVLKNSISETNQLEERLEGIKFLGIKGSGSLANYGYKDYDGNTTESVRNALDKLDGAVIDLQLSKEGTFWVYDAEEVKDCPGKNRELIEMNDESINYASNCWHDSRLLPLNEMLYELTYTLNPEKVLALNLRFLDFTKPIERLGGKTEVVDSVLNKIEEYFKDYEVEVMLQIANDTLYPLFKKKSNYKLYHKKDNLENITKKENYIFPIELVKTKTVDEIKSKDFQITEVNTLEDMVAAMRTNTHFIQTQDVDLGAYFRRVGTISKVDSLLFHADSLNMTAIEDKQLLAELNLDDFEDSFILNFSLVEISNEGAVFIEYIGENKDGNELFWESRGIVSNTFYRKLIKVEELKDRGVEKFSIFINNQSDVDFHASFIDLKLLNY